MEEVIRVRDVKGGGVPGGAVKWREKRETVGRNGDGEEEMLAAMHRLGLGVDREGVKVRSCEEILLLHMALGI